jgi:hypothetical protein
MDIAQTQTQTPLGINTSIIPGFNSNIFSGVSSTVESMSGITAFGLIMLITYAITKVLNFYEVGPNVYGSYLVFYVFLIISAFNLPKHHLIR